MSWSKLGFLLENHDVLLVFIVKATRIYYVLLFFAAHEYDKYGANHDPIRRYPMGSLDDEAIPSGRATRRASPRPTLSSAQEPSQSGSPSGRPLGPHNGRASPTDCTTSMLKSMRSHTPPETTSASDIKCPGQQVPQGQPGSGAVLTRRATTSDTRCPQTEATSANCLPNDNKCQTTRDSKCRRSH